MLNVIAVQGRLVADPELKTTTTGVQVCSFRIANDKNDAAGGTNWLNITAWRNNADFVSKYFHKGDMIIVRGQLSTREYEDKSGNKRTAYEIVIDHADFCGGKRESGNAEQAEASHKAVEEGRRTASEWNPGGLGQMYQGESAQDYEPRAKDKAATQTSFSGFKPIESGEDLPF